MRVTTSVATSSVRAAIERSLDTAAEIVASAIGPRAVSFKADGSPVTDLDARLDSTISRILHSADAGPILSEERRESHDQARGVDPFWVLDPLDGTKNLATDLPIVAVSIAYVSGRSVLASGVWSSLWNAPMLSWRLEKPTATRRALGASPVIGIDLDHTDPEARRVAMSMAESISARVGGVRVLGSTATSLVAVARGSLDAYLRLESPVWDYAGGVGLVEASGGRTRSGELSQLSPYLLAGRPDIDEQLWSHLVAVADGAAMNRMSGGNG